MNKFQQRQHDRRTRLEARANKARSASRIAYTAAKEMASVIPAGQPVLAGHYSESRDRNYRDRIHKTFGKSFALDDRADELERRAAAVGKGGVSSDDPDAVAKLRAQLVALEDRHDRMKRTNQLVRRDDRAGLARMGYQPDAIDKLFTPDFAGRVGFAPYEITNSSANIRRIRDRIAQLEKIAARTSVEQQGEGYVYREDIEDNRAAFIFDAKPAKNVRELLRRNAFLFSPTRSPNGTSAYVRKLTPAAISTAAWLRPQIDQLLAAC
ncbi:MULTISPECIES: DUF3560 domain-containing protein [Burkholderia]|uniref:DUF3560 domain-containing protein n=1 Tax=Burkholderia TaxID=32008 RepID=UPI0010474A65|nr:MULTISPECIES: DUF3560 domain-containing protein [Burkholderia]MCA7888337.1 DUF3560 domain-containing protein [Burkholderia contaminans]TCW75547.1 conjugal transfer protein TraC [Burkholderia sp. SRS-46]